jgi:hypothetical protein
VRNKRLMWAAANAEQGHRFEPVGAHCRLEVGRLELDAKRATASRRATHAAGACSLGASSAGSTALDAKHAAADAKHAAAHAKHPCARGLASMCASKRASHAGVRRDAAGAGGALGDRRTTLPAFGKSRSVPSNAFSRIASSIGSKASKATSKVLSASRHTKFHPKRASATPGTHAPPSPSSRIEGGATGREKNGAAAHGATEAAADREGSEGNAGVTGGGSRSGGGGGAEVRAGEGGAVETLVGEVRPKRKSSAGPQVELSTLNPKP